MPPKKPRPDPELVDLLERWLYEARSGALQSVFIVGARADGVYFPEESLADDPDDLLFEVRSAVIRQGCALLREPH